MIKKFLFSFLFSTILFISCDKVFAIQGVDGYVNDQLITNNWTYSFTQSLNSYSFDFSIVDQGLHNYYYIYAQSATTDFLNISLNTECNNSCFGSNYYVKKYKKVGSINYYVIVLPNGKADCGVGTGACIIENSLTLQGNQFGFNLQILGIDASTDDIFINNDFQNFENIINTYNNNTNNIINNQNSNQQQTNDRLDNINDSMNNDNVDNNNQNNTLNNINSQLATNSVISDLLLLPVTLYTNVLNSINSNTCQSFYLGSLYGTDLYLPCINMSEIITPYTYNVIDYLISGLFVLSIRKKFVDIFNNMTNLKNGGNELE